MRAKGFFSRTLTPDPVHLATETISSAVFVVVCVRRCPSVVHGEEIGRKQERRKKERKEARKKISKEAMDKESNERKEDRKTRRK